MCWGYFDCLPGLLPAEAIKVAEFWSGKGEGAWWTEQGDVEIEEVDGGGSLSVTGFVGPHALKLNGVYAKSSIDAQSGLPAYVKSDAVADRWLEYHVGTSTWQFKPPVDMGKDACWAFNLDKRKLLPHKATDFTYWIAKCPFEVQDYVNIATTD